MQQTEENTTQALVENIFEQLKDLNLLGHAQKLIEKAKEKQLEASRRIGDSAHQFFEVPKDSSEEPTTFCLIISGHRAIIKPKGFFEALYDDSIISGIKKIINGKQQ